MDIYNKVALYDASNVTLERRAFIHDTLKSKGFSVLFIETICDIPQVIETNIRETKLHSPDYANMPEEEAMADFRKRIESYRAIYQPIEDPTQSYIKWINVGQQIIVNNVWGYLHTRIVYYLMNLHIANRIIYFAQVIFHGYTSLCYHINYVHSHLFNLQSTVNR